VTPVPVERAIELVAVGRRARRVYVAPSQFECMFVSLAHGDDEIDRTVKAVGDVFGG